MIARPAALLALALLPAAAVAQMPSAAPPIGSRVRVFPAAPTGAQASTFRSVHPVVGILAQRRADTLVISVAPHGATAWFPRSSIGRLEVSQGVPPRSVGGARGVLRGLRFGLAVAPIATLAAGSDRRRYDYKPLALSLGLSALAGAVAGALAPEEQWVPVLR